MKAPALTNLLLSVNLLVTGYLFKRVVWGVHGQDGFSPTTTIEVRTKDATHPFLATVEVERELTFTGDQFAASFNLSIRGKSYIVRAGAERYVLYSPHLQQLVRGTKVNAWFAWTGVTTTESEGKLPFMVPVELISSVNTVTPQ